MQNKHHLPKEKYLIFFSLLLLFLSACRLLTVRGNGSIITETRDAHDFSQVVFSGTGELLLTQGEEESLTVTIDDNLTDYVEAEVRGETLYIGLMNKLGATVSPSQPVRFNLNVKELNGLNVAGTVTAETGKIATDQLAIRASGSASLQIAALEAQKLAVHLSGTNEVQVMGMGNVADQEIVINGSSNYHAPGLQSQSVDVKISGTGQATVWTTNFLDITISGTGRLDYYGNPQISQNTSGNASINSLGIP